jgi:predicted RNase H-like HicB family nuclease
MSRKTTRPYSYSVLYEQAPEGGYVAFVPALPGCHTQGETLEETERNVTEAIQLYLESLAAQGTGAAERKQRRSFHESVSIFISVSALTRL